MFGRRSPSSPTPAAGMDPMLNPESGTNSLDSKAPLHPHFARVTQLSL